MSEGLRTIQDAVDRIRAGLELRRRGNTVSPKPDTVIVFARKNGGGKMELCVQHPTGAVEVLSTEP
jgi:hypothetical protein